MVFTDGNKLYPSLVSEALRVAQQQKSIVVRGTGASGEVESDGTYEMTTFNTGDGAILGQHIVTVVVREKMEMPKPDANSHIKYEVPKSLTPSKYASADKSPLRCTVVEGGTEFNIELKD